MPKLILDCAPLSPAVKEIREMELAKLESLAAAYFLETNLPPSKVELVCWTEFTGDFIFHYEFREKKEFGNERTSEEHSP